MQTRYRIVDANNLELFEGHKSRILERLATKKMRDQWSKLSIMWCRYEPKHEECPVWRLWGRAEDFIAQQ